MDKTKLQKEFNKKRKELNVAYKNYVECKKEYNRALKEYKIFIKNKLALKKL